MNISLYIQELLFSKQQVSLPGIGVFELITKSAQIESATGTITPPSKTIKFKFGEDADYSILASYAAKKEGISPSEAIKYITEYSEKILDTLKTQQEYELAGIGVLRMLGTGTIIFLPISSYSTLGESFGLPTINLNSLTQESNQVNINDAVVSVPTLAPVSEGKTSEADAFELIEDEPIRVEPKEEEVPVEAFGEESSATTSAEADAPLEELQPPVPDYSNEPAAKDLYPTFTAADTKPEAPAEPKYTEIASEVPSYEESDDVMIEKSRFGWIWMFLVFFCVLSICTIALYHYNPMLFEFLKLAKKAKVEEPKVPNQSDTSYYKAITGTLKDTSSKDSTSLNNTSESLQKIDSLAKVDNTAAKPAEAKSKPMTKEEMESLIDEKLKLGSVVANSSKKQINEQPKAASETTKVSSTPKSELKQLVPKPVVKSKTEMPIAKAVGFNVIAASVRNQAEAQKEVARFKSKGYNPTIIDDGKGRIRISIGSYPDSRSATAAAETAKANLGVEAWVLNP